jgi:hypothetical protein
VTNEQYLIVSYFTTAGGGVLAAIATGLALRGPLRSAVARFTRPARTFMGRALFAWLVMGVLLAFMSVGYFGTCDHQTYKSVVEDMPWMVLKTRGQIESIFEYLLAGVLTYALALATILAVWRPPGATDQRC